MIDGLTQKREAAAEVNRPTMQWENNKIQYNDISNKYILRGYLQTSFIY